MISRLSGTLLETGEGNVLLMDVGGVGYEVEVTASVLTSLPAIGEPLTVHTHFVVREDAQLLYGFGSKAERDLFRAFIKINGVGPKLGLAIISSLDVDSLRFVVSNKDVSLLTKVPGIGKTTASRILVELENRFDALFAHAKPEFVVIKADGASTVVQEAEGALVGLGYRPQEASQAVSSVLQESDGHEALTAEEVIRRALRSFDKAVS